MGPLDSNDDDDWPENVGIEFPVTRRTFLGSVGATAVATTAFGQQKVTSDEIALRFAWSNDPEAGGARVLDISIVSQDQPSKEAATQAPTDDPEATDADEADDAPPPEFREISQEESNPGRGRFWRVRPETFGPNVYFALKTYKTADGLLTYELRVADVAYGRLKPRTGQRRSITFIFRQTDMPVSEDPAKVAKRFVLTASTDIWSSELRPSARRRFTMSGPVENNRRRPLLFRDFIASDPDHNKDLYIDLPLKRITNTVALMFNGLISPGPSAGNPVVDLYFTSNGSWHIKSREAALSAFGGRVPLSELDIFWPTVSTRNTEVSSEAPLFAAASPRLTPSRRIEIGNGKKGPGFRGTLAKGAKRIFFRMQAPKDAPKSANLLRAEAMVQAEWTSVSFEGARKQSKVRNLPDMVGALLERVDHADALDDALPAAVAGTISFQARYGTTSESGEASAKKVSGSTYANTETPIGRLVTQGVRDGEIDETSEDFSFPKRRGWPVTALFNWPGRRNGTRTNPVPQLIDAEVGVVEAGLALPGAQYSRLTFEPSALRIFYSETPLERPPIGSFLDLDAPDGGEFARLDLARASLRASRSDNLLSLRFAFSDLALSLREGKQEFVSYNTSCDITTRSGDFDALQPHDTRPTLVVEFPPQHLFEEARFFQTTPPLPDVKITQKMTYYRVVTEVEGETKSEGTLDAEDYDNGAPPPFKVTDALIEFDSDNRVHLSDAIALLVRSGDGEAVKKFREKVRNFKRTKTPTNGSAQEQFIAFDNVLTAGSADITKPAGPNLPEHQLVYVGPIAMDVDVRQYVRKMFDAWWTSQAATVVDKMFDSALKHASRIKPEEAGAIFPESFDDMLRVALQIEGMLPLYQRFRDFWREQMVSLLLAPDSAAPAVRKLALGDRPRSTKPEEIEHVPYTVAVSVPFKTAESTDILNRRTAAVKTAFRESLFQREDLSAPSRARLANPSRLAFRVNCRDGLDAIRTRENLDLDQPEDYAQRLPREGLPFHLDTLTSFQGMELAVTSRAEVVYDPGELGLISARRPRIADSSGDAMLMRLGFRIENETSARTRLADIANSLKPPTALETAIEMPARLTLSPHQNAVVLTQADDLFADSEDDPFDYIPEQTDKGDRAEALNFRKTEALWQAQFVTEADGLGLNPGLRAVHSPDLRPGALLTRFAEAQPGMPHAEPPGGAFDPWFLSRIQGQSPTMSKAELDALKHLKKTEEDGTVHGACDLPAHEVPGIVARLCAYFRQRTAGTADEITMFRGPMDARDRHQIVLLSSAWGLPVIGRRDIGGTLKRDASQFEPTSRSAVWDVMPGSAIYQPKTLDVTELALSCIGGTLRHDTGFQPPAGALFWQDNVPIFDALSIERWQQWTNLGRDIYTEVVYKGFLFPLGMRASLVKVTERIFHLDPVTGAISAPLRQRMFIRVANPEKLYPAIKQPFGGRRFPVKRVNLLTTTTPDIVDPNDNDVESGVTAHGRIGLGSNGRGIAFWPRMFGDEAGNIRFEMDLDGVKTDLPLIFVDNTAANHQDSLRNLVAYYATVVSPETSENPQPVEPTKHIRTLLFGGAERRYSEEVDTGGATFQTDHWTLSATGIHDKIDEVSPKEGEPFDTFTLESGVHVFGPTLQGADQPPFYPVMETARIHLTQTERLIGRTLPPARAHFDARYIAHGFVAKGSIAEAATLVNPVPDKNDSEVVLILRDQPALDMGRKGDQSGGVYRPSGYVAALSRSKGALTQAQEIKLPAITTAGVHAFSGLFTLSTGPVTSPDNSDQPTGTQSQSFDPTTAVTSESSTSDVEDVLEEIREIYKSYLGDDSKILGLVSLRELIDLIQRLSSPDQGLPELAEKTEFGAGLLEGVEDAANFIRERIVAPLAAAVRRIRDGWDEIEDSLNEGQNRIGVPVKPVTISEIFPELDNALTRLAESLSKAEGETDEIAFAFELGACYSSGQHFLGALERAAANPGQRVEEALSSRYTEILGLFKALRDGIGPWLVDMAIRAIWRQIDPDAELPAQFTEFDLETLTKDHELNERILAVAEAAVKSGVEDTASLAREIIRLPRTPAIYDAPGQGENSADKRFQACIRALVPDDEDIEIILNALAIWLLEESRVISFFTDGVPEPEKLINDFLNLPGSGAGAVTLEFDNTKVSEFFDGMSGTIAEHLDVKIDELVEDVTDALTNVESEKNVDLSSIKAEIAELVVDIKADVHTGTGRIFEGAATDATTAIRSGNVKQQIRNRYLACVLLNMIEDSQDCIPEFANLDPEWLRDFFRWLRSLLKRPNDLPDLPNIFRPIAELLRMVLRLLEELAKLLKALLDQKIPDFGPLLALLRQLLEKISFPGLSINVCEVLEPAWTGASFAMDAVADLGDALTHPKRGANTMVFHPPDWTGPPCPFGNTSQAKHVDENWHVTSFSKAHKNSLNASIFAIRAYTDMLRDITGRNAAVFTGTLTAGQEEQKKLFEAYEELVTKYATQLNELATKLGNEIADLAPDAPNLDSLEKFKKQVDEKIDLLNGSIKETIDCMTELSDASGKAHCSLREASEAIARLSTDLHRAAGLPVCENNVFSKQALDAVVAMSHLPADVRRTRDTTDQLAKDMHEFVRELVDKVRTLEEVATDQPVALLALAVKTDDLFTRFTLGKSVAKYDDDVDNVNGAMNDLKAWVEKTARQTKELVTEIIKAVCKTIDQVDALRSQVEEIIDEAERQILRAEAWISDGNVPDTFKPQVTRLIAETKREVNIDQRRADMAEVRKVFDTLRSIRAGICPLDENGEEKTIPLDEALPLSSLTTLKFEGSDVNAIDRLQEAVAKDGKIAELGEVAKRLSDGVQPLVEELRQFLDSGPRDVVQKALAPYVKQLIAQGIAVPDSSLTDASGNLSLASLYRKLTVLRNEAYDQLDVLPAADILQEAFVVAPDGARAKLNGKFEPGKFGNPDTRKTPAYNDQLSGDAAWLERISQSRTDDVTPEEMRFLTEFSREWASGESTPLVIFDQIVDLVDDILSGSVFKNIDFAKIREEVEDYLLSLVPSKIRMGYGFNIELGTEVAKATAGIFAPKAGTRLGIDMKIVIDLLKATEGDVSIDFRSVGTLGPFDIKLVGKMFDALTLSFASAEFVTEGGSKSDIKIVYTDHKIGPKLKFVEKLQKYLAPKDGSGAIIRFYPNQPGLEAGYRLHLGDFSVGNLAFTNVGLETTAILPFSDSEALFKASLSSRPNPFTLTYAPYGGSGFFAIFATVEGIIGFEASFEFGGSGVFAAGPLSGQGRIMSGVYIRQLKLNGVKITEISMTFFAGGSASIWIFNFAAALSVKLGMINGNMTGEATFSFSFSMGLADFEYSITMFKQEGQGFQGQSAQLGTRRTASLADHAKPHQKENKFGAVVETAGRCQSRDWSAFKSYFDDSTDLGDYF